MTEVVHDRAGYERGMEFAHRLAGLDPFAIGHTERGLNEWLKLGESGCTNSNGQFPALINVSRAP